MAAMTEREQQRLQMLRKLEKEIQGLNNEMEFIEILAQFWPWQNMSDRVNRLELKIQALRRQYHACSAPPPTRDAATSFAFFGGKGTGIPSGGGRHPTGGAAGPGR